MEYTIVPKRLGFAFGRLILNAISCVPTLKQVGPVEALRCPPDEIDGMVPEFQARRDLELDGLNPIPRVNCLRPSGAFDVLPDIVDARPVACRFREPPAERAGVSVPVGTALGGPEGVCCRYRSL